MRIFVLGFFLLLSSMSIGSRAHASILDQSFEVNPSFFGAAVYISATRAQTFTVGVSGVLDRVEIQIGRKDITDDDLVLELRTTTGGRPDLSSAALLGSVSLRPADVPIYESRSTTPTFATFDFSSQMISLNEGDVLALVAKSRAGSSSEWYAWSTTASNQVADYLRGESFFINGTVVADTEDDSGFRTYMNTLSSVPEPASIAMWSLGLCALFLSRRRLSSKS